MDPAAAAAAGAPSSPAAADLVPFCSAAVAVCLAAPASGMGSCPAASTSRRPAAPGLLALAAFTTSARVALPSRPVAGRTAVAALCPSAGSASRPPCPRPRLPDLFACGVSSCPEAPASSRRLAATAAARLSPWTPAPVCIPAPAAVRLPFAAPHAFPAPAAAAAFPGHDPLALRDAVVVFSYRPANEGRLSRRLGAACAASRFPAAAGSPVASPTSACVALVDEAANCRRRSTAVQRFFSPAASAGLSAAGDPSFSLSARPAAAVGVGKRLFFSQRSAGLKLPRYQRVYAMTAKELRHAVADAARRQLRTHDLWDAFLYRACVLRSELTPEQVASLFHSLAAVEKPLLSFIDFILEDVRRRSLHRFRLQDASLLLAALARLKGARDPLLLHALLPVLLKRLRPPAPPSPLPEAHSGSGSGGDPDDRGRSCSGNTSKNQLSTLKHIALLAHAYVKLRGPQTELLLSSIAARLAAPASPLLPVLHNGGREGILMRHSGIGKGRSSSSCSGKKKKSKIHMPHCLALLLGAFAAHARTVCERAAAAAQARAAAAASASAAAADDAGLQRKQLDVEEESAEEDEEEKQQQQQIPFAAVIEALLEHGLLQLSEFSPRDCACFLKALADLLACDRSCCLTAVDSNCSSSQSSRSSNGWEGGSRVPMRQGLLLLGGVAGLRGILQNVYRRLLRLRFDMKCSDGVVMLSSAWPLEQLLAAAAPVASLSAGPPGDCAAAAGSAAAVASAAAGSTEAADVYGGGVRPRRSQVGGDAKISQLLLQELLFRAADLPAAAVLDAMHVLLERRQQQSTWENRGSGGEVFPALEAALLCRLGAVMPSLLGCCPGSTEARRRRSLLVTPAAVAELLRQLCAPRVQPYLPPSFAPPVARQATASKISGGGRTWTSRAAQVAAHCLPRAQADNLPGAATLPREQLGPSLASEGAAARTFCLGLAAEVTVAAAEAVLAAEAAAETAAREGGPGSFGAKVEPVYCLSSAAGGCLQRLLAALAASGDAKRLLNLQTAATLCWTCAALRVRDPLLERLLLQQRNSLCLSLAATRAAAAAETTAAAAGDAAVPEESETQAEKLRKSAAATSESGAAAGNGRLAAPAKAERRGSAVAGDGGPAWTNEKTSVYAFREGEEGGVEAAAAGCKEEAAAAAEDETAADAEEDLNLEAAGELEAADAEGDDALLELEPLFTGTREAEEEAPAAGTGGGAKKEAGAAAALATLAAGLAHLGMPDVADALAVFPLLATVEEFTEVKTALTALVAAAVFDLTRPPKTLAPTLLAPAANTVYERRATLLPAHYASLTFIGSSSIPDAFPPYLQHFFRLAWRFCSPLHPLHCSKVTYAGGAVAAAAPATLSMSQAEQSCSPAVTAAAARHWTPAAGAADWGRTPSGAAATGAGTWDHATDVRAPSFSSAGSVSPHVFATLVHAAPHRCRASTADLLRAVCARGESHQRSSSSTTTTTDIPDTVGDAHWRDRLLRVQSEYLAAQLLYNPFGAHRGGDGRLAERTSGHHPADAALPSAARAAAEATQQSGDSSFATGVFSVESSPVEMLSRDGYRKVGQELNEDEVNVEMTSAAAAASVGEEVSDRRAIPQQILHDCRTVHTFPERVRRHFRTQWKGVRLHNEVFVPACGRWLPFAIELQSVSQHIAALAKADYLTVVADANAAVREVAGEAVAGGETAGTEEAAARAAAGGTAASSEAQDCTSSACPPRSDRSTVKAYNEEADSVDTAEVYRGRTTKKEESAYVSGFDGRIKRHNFRRSACESHPAITKRTAEEGVGYLKTEERDEVQEDRNSRRKRKDGQGKTGRNIPLYTDNIRSMRRWQQQKANRTTVVHGVRERKGQAGVEEKNRSRSSATRKKKQAAAYGCRVGVSGQRSSSRRWSKSQGGNTCASGHTTVGISRLRSRCEARVDSQHLAGGEHRDSMGTAWAMVDCTVIRRETHALIELLWNDFDFLRGVPERKTNRAAFSHTSDTGKGQRRLSPLLFPGKVAELNALKKQGWSVFCLSEATWRSIENSRAKGKRDGMFTHPELKLYVMQCIAGLNVRTSSRKRTQRQQHRKQQ